MALKGTFLCLCLLAGWSSGAAQHETQNCESRNLATALQEALQCNENQSWDAGEAAELLQFIRNLTASLHKHQLKACQGAEPRQCPDAEIPRNGGLACVTVANKRYCKPLCNDGYDFGFLRRSRLYEECSERTGYKWSTHYIGGNKLAVCNGAILQVSGVKTAYFSKDQDCLASKSRSILQIAIIQDLISELKVDGVEGEAQHACLVCG